MVGSAGPVQGRAVPAVRISLGSAANGTFRAKNGLDERARAKLRKPSGNFFVWSALMARSCGGSSQPTRQ